MKRTIILDVDTGVDDAIAIILALKFPELDVKAITTVSGNVHVDEVTKSTKVVIGIAGSNEVRLGKGSSVSLRRTRFHAPEVHGEDGLGNMRSKYIQYSERIKTERAVPLILEIINESRVPVTIVATGPLTNIARAIQIDKRKMQKVKRIISMGGAFNYPGNTGPLAEFNYYVDPDAVDVVARSGITLTILPLNVTEKLPLLRDDVEKWTRQNPSTISRFICDISKFYMTYHKKGGSINGGYLHDPLAVAIAALPSLIMRSVKIPFLIETNGLYTSGTTINRDARAREKKAPVVTVITHVNRGRFMKIFRSLLFSRG